ncbi:GWxTD domain-containing protein [Occallatibacter riparius]|uniref:GWxTD domain-containing protein n=1 Tax=Occallatibacter riparius TaxID=1002689 RepID=A0A9J7BQS2_9BACT|nr:GWxTD domain-containing protein [Occallatibacter riparius]UWZ84090.1 GWxTD domain-containing protein [Occallatibacter riparius]
MSNRRSFLAVAMVCGLISISSHRLHAQSASSNAQAQPSTAQDEPDPLKRERSDKEKFAADRLRRQELKGAYKTWLDQDVAYIISDEERKAFKNLSNDEERDAFIETFWLRRNPNPDSPENEFREEHYRRIAYANEHFAAGKPGWKTDRGHIYIAFGKPDSIDSHPSGGAYQRPIDEGGGSTSTFPFEVWHYRYLEGIGDNIDIEFVDTCQCGDYHFTIDRGEKDALLRVPGMGLTQWESMGMAKKADRFHGGPETLGTGPLASSQQSKEFDRLELAAKLFAPPPVKFKDLESAMTSHSILNGPPFPFDVRTDFVKVTDSMVLVPITLQLRNRDITFETKNGVSRGVVNILGKVTTITHRVVQTFEDTVEVEQPAELLEKSLDRKSIYWKALPLLPGSYRLDIAIKDVHNPDHVGVFGRSLEVPKFYDEKLATSSLILADQMAVVDSHSIGGTGNCVIGNTKICPRVGQTPTTPVSFTRNQQLNFWMQVYNLQINDATKSNNAKVTYQIVDTATNNVIFEKQLDSKDLGEHSDQLTVEKSLPIAGLQPGKYQVTIKVNDEISKQEIAKSAPFVVE